MSALTKCAGSFACVVAVIGVAVAQGNPPDPRIADPALGAGQQSTHQTPMGETGVLAFSEVRTATITREPQVAQVAQPAPATAPEPAPAPAPVAQAPAPTPAPIAMGAAPDPVAQPAPMRRRADRN